MHLINDGRPREIDIELVRRFDQRLSGAVRPPQDRIGDVLAVRGINDQVVGFAGGAKGLLDQGVVVGYDDDQRHGNGRDQFVE